MAWGRIDDDFEAHPKRLLVSPTADGLLMRAIGHACKHGTDGFVTAAWMELQVSKLRPAHRREVLDEIVRYRLFETVVRGETRECLGPKRSGFRSQSRTVLVGPFDCDGYLIHDFLHCNYAACEVAEKRAAERGKKRKQRENGRQDALPWDAAGRGDVPGVVPPLFTGDSPPIGGSPGMGVGEEPPGSSFVSQKDVRAPEPLPDDLAGRVGAVIGVLAQVDRLHIHQMGVENAIGAFPAGDHLAAAREVVTWTTDPAFRMTNAARLLHRALSQQDERARRPARHGAFRASPAEHPASIQARQWLEEAERLEAEERAEAQAAGAVA